MTTHRKDDNRTRLADDQPALAADYRHFVPGTRVRDRHGDDHEVREQIGCAVFMKDGRHFHPTKIFAAE